MKPGSSILIFYCISLLVCFLGFLQSDLVHTFTSSYTYVNGYFFDFYEHNKTYVGGNDYLPLVYIIFALWSLPFIGLNLLDVPDSSSVIGYIPTISEVIIFKAILAICFFLSALLVHKISKLIYSEDLKKGYQPAILFISSPIAIFAVFIFSQYDIFNVVFTLLGLYSYFKKNFLRFALYFSVAISFKFYAVIIYLPLVLLIEKRAIGLAKFCILGALITVIQIGVYWNSEIFQESYFSLASK